MIVDDIINEFENRHKIYKSIDIDWGSSDITRTDFIISDTEKELFDVDFVDKKQLKEAILQNIDNFAIEQCMQVYLEYSSSDRARRELEKFYPVEEANVEKYCNKFNSIAKYWQISVSIDDIVDSGGWQFLEFPRYSLQKSAIEQLKKELKGDDTMFEDLIARVRVYKAKGDMPYQHRPYELKLVSDKTKTFKNVNQDDDRNNISKAEFIFHELSANGVDDDNYDGSESNYDNVKTVEAIYLGNRDLHTQYHNLQYEQRYRGRDGWEICGIDLTRVIMFKFTLTDNTIIRFDFQGMIDNEEGTQGIYFQDIIDKNADAHEKYKKEKRTEELIQQIRKEEDVILELSASPLYDNPKSNFHKDSGLVPQGEFAYMLEFFSDLIGYDEETYQGAFGLNSRYIKDAMKLITKVENRAKEIEEKYADKGVKVTVNGMNDGCEYGMAVYVWIPYQ